MAMLINKTSFIYKLCICIIYIPVIFIIISCSSKKTNENTDTAKTSLPEEKNLVDATIVNLQDFNKEIISNGKFEALKKAELYFKTQGVINKINAKNGQKAGKSQVIASLEKEELEYNIQKAELNFEKASIDRKDALLGMGYDQDNTNKVREDHLRIANIRSGYREAQLALEDAQRQLGFASIKAPFAGIIAGIGQKPFEKANISDPFCTIINDVWFEVKFPLLETEVGSVKTGQKVEITPLAGNKSTTGKITEINPRIDENGLAWLKASVQNPGGYIEGMNVKVSIKETVPGQLIVPKAAVVLRQNREVLFRYTKGIAYWTYIQVLDENNNSYAVIAADGATLNPGDTVIINNNLNLAHESEVEIEKVD